MSRDRAAATTANWRHLRPDAASALRVIAVFALVLVLLASLLAIVLIVYGNGVDLSIAGLRLTSHHPFRPVVVAILAWLALGRFLPRLRPNRESWVTLVCLATYASMFDLSRVSSGDGVPSEYGGLSIVSGRGLSLDGYPELVEQGIPYFIRETPIGLRSEYATGPELLVWPLYLPVHFSSLPPSQVVHRVGNAVGLLAGLGCVVLAMRVARKLASPVSPALIGFAYGIGTLHWSAASTELNQHAPGELWMLAALDRLLDEDAAAWRRLAALGACMALAAFTRPPLGLPIVIIAAMVLYRYRARAILAYASAAAVALPLVWYNVETYASPLGAYSSRTRLMSVKSPAELATNAYWLVTSANRGDIWYEPLVMFGIIVGLAVAARRGAKWTLHAGLAGFLTTLLCSANWSIWWGGYTFGPRFMVDALPWWILVVASLGRHGRWFKQTAVVLTAAGALINVVGIKGRPGYWDSFPSVDLHQDRLFAFEDSQIEFGALHALPRSRVRRAVDAESRGDVEQALALWMEDYREHPRRRFSGYWVANLLLRTDRLEEAKLHADRIAAAWPDSTYARHLSGYLPRILSLLGNEAWRKPVSARASPNGESAPLVYDASFNTRWSTVGPQRRGDWLELVPPPGVKVKGVAVFSLPDFGHEPSGLELFGIEPAGGSVNLGLLGAVAVPRKGWVAIRFDPVELVRLKATTTGRIATPWSVSEARLLVESSPTH